MATSMTFTLISLASQSALRTCLLVAT